MSEKKPGLIRKFFRLIGKVVSAIRYMISLVIVLFFYRHSRRRVCR